MKKGCDRLAIMIHYYYEVQSVYMADRKGLDRMAISEDGIITIRTLGEFSLSCGTKRISDADGRTKKVWLLLEYLVTNRGKDISMEQLAEAVWNDEDESNNPGNALKNLVYRARTVLRELCPDSATEYIIFSRNSYLWNRELPCRVDVEEFEEFCAKGADPHISQDERIKAYMQAIELYRGEFLPKSSFVDWVISKNAYYMTLYSKAVEQVVNMLFEQQRYEDVVTVCDQAVVLYPYNESVHYALLRALIDSGQRRKAISHYEYISDFFYKKLGVTLSDPIRALYKEMTSGMEMIEADMDSIENDLRESEKPTQAYYCDYEVFKQIYRFQARSIARTGQSVHIGLLTVRNMKGEVPDIRLLQTLMNTLRDVVVECLRKGDVVSAYSTNQLVVMLPMTTFENGEMVLRRIFTAFVRKHRTRDCFVDTKLREITPSAV